jgi:putative endopeptidase
MLPKVGYPDVWKTYDSVSVSADDLVGDVKQAEAWAWDDGIAKLGKPIDRAEWMTAAQINNGFYGQNLNDLSLPAGILQPPYYDPAADPAVIYGELAGGAPIGHEMSHAFDDSGRQFDASGALRDWWTQADADRYHREADKMVAQFNAYEPLPGAHIDGELTLEENMADLAGVQVAYDAYKSSLGGQEAPVLDGLTGDQRFFIAYAASWKWLYRDEATRDSLLSDVHSPPKYRVNGIVRNLDAWYDAFDVKEGDALYLAPEQRVRLW